MNSSVPNAFPISPSQRCAIYTRKSAQPPIAQEFTSIESQRAICSSYIVSQQHKGWVEISKAYDDAGRSGSNLDRPAVQQLLDDIEQGLVDVVLVYKMDGSRVHFSTSSGSSTFSSAST